MVVEEIVEGVYCIVETFDFVVETGRTHQDDMLVGVEVELGESHGRLSGESVDREGVGNHPDVLRGKQ